MLNEGGIFVNLLIVINVNNFRVGKVRSETLQELLRTIVTGRVQHSLIQPSPELALLVRYMHLNGSSGVIDSACLSLKCVIVEVIEANF
jgi:hypothetical protein